MTCPLCSRVDPHAHDLGVVLNPCHFCPDGERHNFIEIRHWFRRRLMCIRCDEMRRP